MAITVPIKTNEFITWRSLIEICFGAITSACCNIDTYKNVPARLQAGQGQFTVYTRDGIGITESNAKWSTSWTTTPANLISIVTSSSVDSEWRAFITAAGIDAHSNKIVQAKEMGLFIGLYMQFMAYHLKPVCSSRKVYNTAESQIPFYGTKYVNGTVAPLYTLPGIDPNNIPIMADSDIIEVVKRNIGDGEGTWKDYILFNSYNNPVFSTCPLS